MDDFGHEDRPGQVVRFAGPAGQVTGPFAGSPVKVQRVAVDLDLADVVRHRLPVADCPGEHVEHRRPALERCCGGSLAGSGDDARFCYGLGLDVAAVLHRYGYPKLATGTDLSRILQTLFTLIYEETR